MMRPGSSSSLAGLRGRGRGGGGGGGRLSISAYIMIFLACLGTVYVGGRLWQDARLQQELVEARKALKARKPQSKALSVEESMMKIELAELQKREALLQVFLAEAKARGYVSVAAAGALPPNPPGENMFVNRKKNGTSQGITMSAKYLAVVGVTTRFADRALRDAVRATWLGGGPAGLKKIEDEHGLVFRFIVGHSPNRGDSSDRAIEEEQQTYKDFLILDDHEEDDHAGAAKLKSFYTNAVKRWDASFYIKTDDDVYVNIPGMVSVLKEFLTKPRLFMGCMKSTEVVTDSNSRWYEPEWQNFGEGKYYMKHAAGPLHVVSKEVALYFAVARNMLHEYKHEDVSLGSWVLGLDVAYEDNRRLCCASAPEDECVKKRDAGIPCGAVYDWHCGGLCEAEKRMSQVHKQCAGVRTGAVAG